MSGLPSTSLAERTLLQPTRVADRGESAEGDVAQLGWRASNQQNDQSSANTVTRS
jgi:hypothetical protein